MSLDLVDQQTRAPNMCFMQRRSAESGRISRGLLRLQQVEQLLNNTCQQGREGGLAVVVEEGASFSSIAELPSLRTVRSYKRELRWDREMLLFFFRAIDTILLSL